MRVYSLTPNKDKKYQEQMHSNPKAISRKLQDIKKKDPPWKNFKELLLKLGRMISLIIEYNLK
jgi:hypothetical protein